MGLWVAITVVMLELGLGVGFVSDHKRNIIPIRKRVYISVVATSVVMSRLGLGLI